MNFLKSVWKGIKFTAKFLFIGYDHYCPICGKGYSGPESYRMSLDCTRKDIFPRTSTVYRYKSSDPGYRYK